MKKKPKWRISTVGRKILITLCFFVVFGVVSLIYLAVVLAEQEKIIRNQEDYFYCELFGNDNGTDSSSNCSHYLMELNDYNALGTTTFTLLGIFPLVIFTFMINWKSVMKKVSAQWRRYCLCCVRHDKDQVEFSTYSPVSASILN